MIRSRSSWTPFWVFVTLAVTEGVICSGANGEPKSVAQQLRESRVRYDTRDRWAARRQALREGFLKGAGLWPMPVKTSVRAVSHSRREHVGYTVENLALETMPGFYCTGNLYRPSEQNRPAPAILCPHGHFKLGRFRKNHQIRCAHFARMGAIVYSYSMVGYQDSQQTTHNDPLVLALQTWNSIRVIDYLTSRNDVDAQRVGVTGASGGGTQTFFVAAIDDRVKASAPLVIVYPWAAPAGCQCEGGLPVMQETHTNAIELAASVSPRAQLIISVGKDSTRDFPTVGFPFIKQMYELSGRADRVQNVHLETEAHDYGPSKRNAVYEFFARHLSMKPIAEDLTKITIETPRQMEVFNDDHPLPEHAAKGTAEIAKVFAALPRPSRRKTSQSPREQVDR